MDVCGVACEQHASLAIGRRLAAHVGEPGDPAGTVHPVVGPVGGDERLAQVLQGGLAGVFDLLLEQYDPVWVSTLLPVDGAYATTLGRMPISGSSFISTSAIR